MKLRRTVPVAVAVALVGGISLAGFGSSPVAKPGAPDSRAGAPAPRDAANKAREAYGKLPLRFEPNQGQTDPQVRFLARTGSSTLFLTPGEAVLSTSPPKDKAAARDVLRMSLAGADPLAQIEPVGRQEGTTNYLVGDQDHWRSGVPGYSKVQYRGVYPGIDAVFHGTDGNLEYDFNVAPGADANRITLQFDGRQPSIDENGTLVLHSPGGDVRQAKPSIYQVVDGSRRSVEGGFSVRPDGQVGFNVGSYDRLRSLVIDPVLAYSTFLGGSLSSENSTAIAIDGTGAAYITGSTDSTDFPLQGAYQSTYGGSSDIFVTKLAPTGSTLAYSTYLGGGGTESGEAIALDGTGEAHITGYSYSSDFPTTPGALESNRTFGDGSSTGGNPTYTSASAGFTAADIGRSISGTNIPADTTIQAVVNATTITLSNNADNTGTGLTFTIGGNPNGTGIVAKLSANGASLVYSTYLHGAGGKAIAVDSIGNALVAGRAGPTFATTAGAFDGNRTFGDGSSTGGDPTYTSASANFSPADVGRVISGTNIPPDTTVAAVIDPTTITLSNNADATQSALTFTLGSHTDQNAFVAKLPSTGAALIYATYLAPAGTDTLGLTLANDLPVVTATTASPAFPVTPGAFDTLCGTDGTCDGGQADVFVTKINPSISGNRSGVVSPANNALVFSTFLGGAASDNGADVAADGSGALYLTGATNSFDFPATPGSFGATCGDGTCNGGNQFAYVTKLASGGNSVTWSGFLGGNGLPDNPPGYGYSIAVDSAANAYVTGVTGTSDFPVVNPIEFYSGGGDAFVTKVAASGTSLGYSTYLGGTNSDNGSGIAADASGNAYVTGRTFSTDFPTTPGALSTTCTCDDAFITKISAGASPPAIRSISPRGGPATGGSTPVVITGTGFTGATSVHFGALTASFTVDSDTQITAIPPVQPQDTNALVTVTGPTGTSVGAIFYYYGEGIWTATGDCTDPCGTRYAVLLDGRVLTIDAGVTNGSPMPAKIYNPLTGTWSDTGACNGCRGEIFQPAPPLIVLKGTVAQCGSNCGKVLWAGGYDPAGRNGVPSKSSFLYDPVAGTWSPTGDMQGGHLAHGMALLPNGKVLAAGGCQATQGRACGPTGGDVPTVNSELYNPVTGTWSLTGPMFAARANFPLTVIDPATGNCGSECGKALATGGINSGNPLSVTEIYDPATGLWSVRLPMSEARSFPLAEQLKSGKVLVYGGYNNATADLYDPASQTWAPQIPMISNSGLNHVGDLLTTGKVLTDGGAFGGANQIYNPATNAWTYQGARLHNHENGIGVTLPPGPLSACGSNCGKALFAGGNEASSSADLYTPTPVVSGVSPGVGRTGGGTVVTITGAALAPVTSVTFGGVAGTGIVHDATSPDTKLTVVAPAHAPGTVNVTATSPGGISSVTPATTFTFGLSVLADFDADAKTDISVFRPSGGTWFVHPSAGGADTGNNYGTGTDIPVPGDYDGDRIADRAIFRPSTGLWAIHKSSGGDTFVTYGGIAGDVPVVADYDGDGKTDIAIYRPSSGTWYVHQSSNNTDTAVTFGGISGDLPIPADFDGDGKADIAIFRSGTWFVHPSLGGTDTATNYGAAGDIPLPVDFDGDGRADVAIFRPGTGLWAIHPSGGGADTFVTYGGVPGDVPVATDYDGDGKADIAIFRPSIGAWYVHKSTTNTDVVTTFGVPGDIPLPIPSHIRRAFF